MAYFILKFLHILSMAAWLGAAPWVPGDIRRTLGLGRDEARRLRTRAGPALKLDLAAGIATLVTGLLLASPIGAPSPIRAGIYAGLAVTLLLLAVVVGGMLPAWRRIESAIASEGDLATASAPARRLGALSGVHHLLWLAALAVMVFPV